VAWTFVVYDLAGNPLGELRNAHNRRVERPLSRMDTCSFTLRPDNPQATALFDDRVIVAFDSNANPRFAGEVISADEQIADQQASIAVTCAGALARLEDRLVGKSNTGVKYGSAIALRDRGQMAVDVLNDVNADGDTGVRIGTIGNTSDGYAGPWYYKPASEAILELSGAMDGFEFRFDPQAPVVDASGVAWWEFNASPAFGSLKENVVFEFGTGKKNVKAYGRQVDRSQLLNRGYGLPPGFPDNASSEGGVVTSDAPASIANRGLHEGVVQSDLVSQPLRARLVEEHVTIRKVARQMITFTPKLNLGYTFEGSFYLGDTVPFRAVWNGHTRIDNVFRIFQVAWDIDDLGNEQMELTLTPLDT
jgi:hypothetical protein